MDRHPLVEFSDPALKTWIRARLEPPHRSFYAQESRPADHDACVRDSRLRIRALRSERDPTGRPFTHVDGKLDCTLWPSADGRGGRPPPRCPTRARGASYGEATQTTGWRMVDGTLTGSR